MVNIKEVSAMLTYISELDTFIQPNEITVRAWADVLNDNMTSGYAKDYVVRYYGKPFTRSVRPGDLNEGWSHQPNASPYDCKTCGSRDHHYAEPAVPPNEAYLQMRAKLGHSIGGVLDEIEAASTKASA